jgi:divalent metal cation (Fe/Co/Zn/Cd) transporter
MDGVDPSLVDQATAAITSVTGITGVRDLRIRWIGHTLRAEVEGLPPVWLTPCL